MNALQCHRLAKQYGEGELAERAVADISMELRPGEGCALLGPSGSGKTTLLSMLGCLLTPTAGELHVGGRRVDFSDPRMMIGLRRRQLGFVFQHAQLLPFLSIRENLSIVARNAGLTGSDLRLRVDALLARLRIDAHACKTPDQLSGGQRQRVAIARALLHRPRVVLADEPTAALDWDNGQMVLDLLLAQARENGAALLMVTHDTRLMPRFDRVIRMENGRIGEEGGPPR